MKTIHLKIKIRVSDDEYPKQKHINELVRAVRERMDYPQIPAGAKLTVKWTKTHHGGDAAGDGGFLEESKPRRRRTVKMDPRVSKIVGRMIAERQKKNRERYKRMLKRGTISILERRRKPVKKARTRVRLPSGF